MVRPKNVFLAAFVLILTTVGFTTSLTGNELKIERDACLKLVQYKFHDDVRANLSTAYKTLDKDMVDSLFTTLNTKGNFYYNLKMPKVPNSNYLFDYMYHMFTKMEINYKVVVDPILYCKEGYKLYDVSCPQTLRLMGFPTFGTTEEDRKKILKHLYFYFTAGDMSETVLIRGEDKNFNVTPFDNIPEVFYMFNYNFPKNYYWYIAEIFNSVHVKVTHLVKPKFFCDNIAVLDDNAPSTQQVTGVGENKN